jgi:hypothetical protein
MFLGKYVRQEHWSTIAIPVATRSRLGSTVTRLMGLRVLVPAEEWMSVSCKFCVCCHVDFSATGRSLVQRSSTEYGVFECDGGNSTMRRSRPTRAAGRALKKIWNPKFQVPVRNGEKISNSEV